MSNLLKNQKSPYLLQHAENPVNWYPWCSQAFEAAKSEDKPVFLSIGYSTCHWCHVMAHESFEDEEIARILNRSFISIKVDKEERPDVDAVYMSACQAMTGSGGWPLTILMTPDQKPFYAGTYLPKHSLYGRIGLSELLLQIEQLWNGKREKLYTLGEKIASFLQAKKSASHKEPSPELIRRGAKELYGSFDPVWGGFGQTLKFPMPHNLLFLMRYAVWEQDDKALKTAVKTLECMAKGGIYDQIGGGFSRYSTDRQWMIPHFEKMLYDNALLIYAYAEAYQTTGNDWFLSIVRETAAYVLRELTDAQGGFYCGQDADSDGVEGKYYALTPEEVCSVLGEEDGTDFCRFFGITREGNFEGKSIPHLSEQTTQKDARMNELCHKLYEYRRTRTRLHRDDKILTSWNSLMIAALAKASLICREPDWLVCAKKAQRFLETCLSTPDGRLYVRYRDGEAAYPGNLEDYAFYGWALLELYQATWDAAYLEKAVKTAGQMVQKFTDRESGGFYLYAEDAEQLLCRPKEAVDGALPSGNSAAAFVLSYLSMLTAETSWQEEQTRAFSYLAREADAYPSGHCFALLAMGHALYPSSQLICAAAENTIPEDLEDFLRERFLPGLTVLLLNPENQKLLARLAPFTVHYPLPDTGVVYYLCRGNTCSAPAKDLHALFD
ncbi:MAG TPA: hypothetical protein DD414_01600 [Lachnospiraceae bacterium]|nr:hypothetical protein [Lachnospiraceae bacterium]